MTQAFALPDGFLVGASTAAHQVEGGNTNSDWWALEQRPNSPVPQPSGQACDSWNEWREDIRLLADAGLNAYRFSVEWARIEPSEGEWSAEALAHYRELIAELVALGVRPVVTLHHFTHPAWFTAAGGWSAPEATDRFLAYVGKVNEILDGVHAVITINEPNMLAIMARVMRGDVALDNGLGGGLPLPDAGVRDVLIATHRAAVERLHAKRPGVPLGWSVANQCVQSVDGGEQRAAEYREQVEDVFLRAAAGDDLIGVQAYTRTVFGPDGVIQQPGPLTLTDWEVYPEALGMAVRHTHEMLPDVPILVTENGIATDDDAQRIAYTTGALTGLAREMRSGVKVLGYLHWSLLDNYEWGHWEPRFGLVEVDRSGDFARTPKPSLGWLGAQARARAFQISADHEG